MKTVMMSRCATLVAWAGIAIAAYSTAARATLIGDEISVSTPNFGVVNVVGEPPLPTVISDTIIVRDGRELAFNDGSNLDRLFFSSGDSIDIGAASISVTFGFGFDRSFTFSGLDWTGNPSGVITDVQLVDAQTTSPLDRVTNIEFTDHDIRIGFFTRGNSAFEFALTASDSPASLPAPQSLLLVGLGLLSMSWRRWTCVVRYFDRTSELT